MLPRSRNRGRFAPMSMEESFWKYANKDGPWMPGMLDRCWVWIGGTTSTGYAQMRGTSGHRFSYELYKGKIPEDKQIDHLCRIRLCVNPDHLEAVTARENMMRGKNRAIVNAKHEFCKRGHPLTQENRIPNGECKICSYNRRKLWGRQKRASKRLASNSR